MKVLKTPSAIRFVWMMAIILAALTSESGVKLLAAGTCSEVVRSSLPASGCNRAFSLHVESIDFMDELEGQSPPPGQRWLTLEIRFESWMPSDLLFGLGYPEPLLVATLARQLYLLVDNRLVVRARVFGDSDLDDGFVLPRTGTMQEVRVAFAVPEQELSSLSLRYYHDQYAPLVVTLLDEKESPSALREQALQADGHDLLSLGVQQFSLHDQWQGEPALEGMQWLVVDLRGEGEWTTSVDARALAASADLEDKAALRRVMEYVEAPGLLQVVVDNRHAYVRDLEQSTLEEEPPLLPEVWAGGQAVFPVPKDAETLELVAYMPKFSGGNISSEIRPTLRFPLREGDVPSPQGEPLALIEDVPTPLTLHRASYVPSFAGHRAEEGESLLLIEASMTNLSEVGGMMAVSQRLSLQVPEGELVAAYQRGPLALKEPFWLPADDEPRHFMLLYRFESTAESYDFEYGGVSVNERFRLVLDDDALQ